MSLDINLANYGAPPCKMFMEFMTSEQRLDLAKAATLSIASLDLQKRLRLVPDGDGSIPINTIFRGMNIHLPAILMFTRGTRVLTHCQITMWFLCFEKASNLFIADQLNRLCARSMSQIPIEWSNG